MASPFPPRREGVETLADVEWPREGTPHMADVQFNPMDPAFVEDPYPTYHVLRREDPVHHSPLGFWVLTRYADVIASLRDPRLIKEPIAARAPGRGGRRRGGPPPASSRSPSGRSWPPASGWRCRRDSASPCWTATRRITRACAGWSARPSLPRRSRACGRTSNRSWTACWTRSSAAARWT